MDFSIANKTSLKICDLEEKLLKKKQVECPVYHHFYPGIYMREVHIEAGVFSIGHFQKTEHLNIFQQGRVNFVNDEGIAQILEAPMIFTSKPGRKIGLILEDMVWFNLYATKETDIQKLEETYLDKSEAWKNAQQNTYDFKKDREDFKKLLTEYCITETQVRTESERVIDLVPFPKGIYQVGVFDSPIEGKGLFATSNIAKGNIIAPGRIGELRTPAGRYVNHSATPTAGVLNTKNGVDFVALKDIQGCLGGSLGEEITIDYRDGINLERAICQQ